MHQSPRSEPDGNEMSPLSEMREMFGRLLERADIDEHTWVNEPRSRPKGLVSCKRDELHSLYQNLVSGYPQSWKRTEAVLMSICADVECIMKVARLWLESVLAYEEECAEDASLTPLDQTVRRTMPSAREWADLYSDVCVYDFETMMRLALHGDIEYLPDSAERLLIMALRAKLEQPMHHPNDRRFDRD